MRMKPRFGILLCCWILLQGLAGLGADFATKAQCYLDDLVRSNKFSGAVLVAKEGKPLLSHGYGLANYEHNIPNTPRTKSRLGSITKQFTAMCVLILQE